MNINIENKNKPVLSTRFVVEQNSPIFTSTWMTMGCIGMEIDNYGLSPYTTFRFRRVGMGMYSFRLYDEPLSRAQQDSQNADDRLIVYDDSTVFELGGGVLGAQYFVGKQEFLEKRDTIKLYDNEE